MVIYHTERALPDVVKFTTSGNGCYQGLRSHRWSKDRRLWERRCLVTISLPSPSLLLWQDIFTMAPFDYNYQNPSFFFSHDRAVFNWVLKVISRLLWFCITTLCDWLTKLAPLSQPMGIQPKTNRVFAARVFPRLAPVTCICFKFWLARCVVYICCDWPK